MKGYKEFVGSLLPKITPSAKMVFDSNSVESSVKVADGNLLIFSTLKTEHNLNDAIAIPNIGDLAKALKIMDEANLSLEKVNDVPSKLTISNSVSKIKLFLMDAEYVNAPKKNGEPPFDVCVGVPVNTLQSLKSMYGLIDSDVTPISVSGGKLNISVGEVSANDNNSATVSVDVNSSNEVSLTVQTHIVKEILSKLTDDDIVVVSIGSKMMKVSVSNGSDDYELTTDYYIAPMAD